MISQISEKKIHYLRWFILIGWLLLILSLFYDPISHYLTDPKALISPLRNPIADDPSQCIKIQSECVVDTTYPIATRIFWGKVIPSAILIIFVLGHDTWRRICPLYFVSQISVALGLKPLLNIKKNHWLVNNHLYVQFALLFIGLNARILLINSDRVALGIFFILTILAAIIVVALYGGRSWCHYVCPLGVVQTVLIGPRGLLGSKGNIKSANNISQSMCRIIDPETGEEKSNCINCKSSCMDIDAEKSYWENIKKPGRRLVHYGYLGLCIGFFSYFFLYAGNWDYYFSGIWHHEVNLAGKILEPGFYLFDTKINVPKFIAVPYTLAMFVAIAYWLCIKIEKNLFSYFKKQQPDITSQQVRHRMFSISTFVAFNFFFIYGGRTEIVKLPLPCQFAFDGFILLVSSLWLYRTWYRSAEIYKRESLTPQFRRKLGKLPVDFSGLLKGSSIADLNPDQLEVLAKVLPTVVKENSLPPSSQQKSSSEAIASGK